MSPKPQILAKLDKAIRHQFQERTLESGLETAREVLGLLGVGQDWEIEDIKLTKLQLPNAERYDHWFQPHPFFRSDRSCFELVDGVELPIQAKFYWLQKKSKLPISGGVHFTPNWEDGEFTRTEGYKVGMDFFLTPSADALLVVLSDRGNLRIVELTERLRTTQVEIFTAWMAAGSAKSSEILHSTLWQTFQLQAVNEKFYVGVANAFTELTQHLDTSVDVFSEADSKQFANRLIGRLLFCWFLRKRDILDREQGYFDIEGVSATEYYRSRLEPLFFLTLNTPVKDRATSIKGFLASGRAYLSHECLSRVATDLKTPYLNGGLFENHTSDHFGEPVVSFPDGYFERLFEHFDSYNFTTDESSPEYEQVAIDPEMLGKVFESLLATQVDATGEQARQAIGAFYTPRSIVSYMCNEAMRKVLSEKFADNKKALTAIDALLDTPDSQWASYGTNSRRDAFKGFETVLLQEIREVTIFDPACGSGAFPMGMLQLLVKMHQRLTSEADLYKIKLHFLEKSLYGADIEPMAIEISRLRAWLTLIVDQEDPTNVHSLPNLDFHFICCNSLIRLKDEDSGTFGFFDDPVDEVARIKTRYFYEDSPVVKKALQEEYESFRQRHSDVESDRVLQQLTYHPFNSDSPAKFFDRFEMFGMKNGFDIVIGNPPYVRQERIKYKEALTDYQVFTSTSDLFTYFFEFGIRNLRRGGVLSFITSSKYGRALYGEKLRGLLSTETTIDYLVDYGDQHVFSAITNTWVIQVTNVTPVPLSSIKILADISATGRSISQSQLSSQSWAFSDLETEELNQKIKSQGTRIQDLPYRIYYGIKTGINEVFVIDGETKQSLVDVDIKNAEIVVPLIRGRDIEKYQIRPVTKWLIATKNEFKVKQAFPSIAKYLDKRNKELDRKAEIRSDQGAHWMNLRDCAYYEQMEGKKIIWLELTTKNRFAYSDKGEYILNSAYMMCGPHLHYMLGILNSRMIGYYFQFLANSSGMGTTQWRKYAVEEIPVPKYETCNQVLAKRLEAAVRSRLKMRIEKNSDAALKLEQEIDEIVYEIYGLDSKDIERIETEFPN
jgi:hypothetical protein